MRETKIGLSAVGQNGLSKWKMTEMKPERTEKTFTWLKSGIAALPYLWENCSDALILTDFNLSELHLNPAAFSMMSQLLIDEHELTAMRAARALLENLKQQGFLNRHDAAINEINFRGLRLSFKIGIIDQSNYIFIFRKVSRNKKLKEQLKILEDTNSELNEIIELSADGLVSVDHSGNIIRLNNAYKRILGITDEQFVGKPAQLLVDKGYLPELVSPKVLKHRKSVNIIVTIRGKDVLLTGRPVFNEQGRVIRVVANIRDLTKLNNLKNKLNKYHELANRYETEISHLRSKEIKTKMIGRSDGATKMIALAAQASKVDSTVLVYGETGTGKELLVKSIHQLSEQKNGPFIAVDCSTVPESLIESELFGYEAGAFTGSNKKGKVGLFEAANGGTLFLDEISEMPLSMQAKLLRAIQEKKIRRIGSSEARTVNARIIAASNKRLEHCVEAGNFRADLYYRLNVVSIYIPPLRERKEDIPLLINHFLNEFNNKFGRKKQISEKDMIMLINYDWPGNIRELRNIIERFVVLKNAINLEVQFLKTSAPSMDRSKLPVSCLKSYLKEIEYEIILNTYRKLKSTRKTAEALNVSQSTIARKVKEKLPHNLLV